MKFPKMTKYTGAGVFPVKYEYVYLYSYKQKADFL